MSFIKTWQAPREDNKHAEEQPDFQKIISYAFFMGRHFWLSSNQNSEQKKFNYSLKLQ
jgi:hypothetical protein